MTSVTGSEDGGRLHALDAMRGAALMAGVLFHPCVLFSSGLQLWIVDGEMGGRG